MITTLRASQQSDTTIVDAERFKALGNPARFALLILIGTHCGTLSVDELQERLREMVPHELAPHLDNAASLKRGHFFQQSSAFTGVTDTMSRLDIALRVSTVAGKWYHMVKVNFMMRQDILLTDIAEVTIAFKNTLVTDLLNYRSVFESTTHRGFCTILFLMCPVVFTNIGSCFAKTSFVVTLAISRLAFNPIFTIFWTCFVIFTLIGFSALFALVPAFFKGIEGLFCYRWWARDTNFSKSERRQWGSVIYFGHGLLDLLHRFTGLEVGSASNAPNLDPYASSIPHTEHFFHCFTVSHHLAILARAGFIEGRYEGLERYYHLRGEGFACCQDALTVLAHLGGKQ